MTSRSGGYDLQHAAEFYDVVYSEARPQDVSFFVDYARQSGGPTLELGCGTGRVLVPTAAAGCDITGLDLSPRMLDICRERLAQQPEEVRRRVRLVQADMTDFDTGETYALVTIPFRPFQHLVTVEEQRACLGCINRHLAPEGLLVLDLFHPYPPRLMPDPIHMAETEDFPETELPDGHRFRRAGRTAGYHREEQYNDTELIYYVTHPDGRTERLVQSFPMRYFFRYEVEHLLELCGLRAVDVFGNFDRSPLGNDSPEMIFVARKAG